MPIYIMTISTISNIQINRTMAKAQQGMHFLQIHTQTVEGYEYLKKIRNLRTHVIIQSLEHRGHVFTLEVKVFRGYSGITTVTTRLDTIQRKKTRVIDRFSSALKYDSIDRFHLTSRRPYWCTKTMKWRPYWCTVRELALSYSNISYCFTTPLGPPIT